MTARATWEERPSVSHYEFKPGPYSSHTLLLGCLPEKGGNRRVLDVGCAGGYLARILAQRGYRVTGIERTGGAGADFPAEAELIEADLDLGLPPLAGLFDYILCADVIEHLREPLRLLVELRRTLGPGGRLVASLPNSGNIYFRLNILAGRFPQHDLGLFDRTHLHFYVWDGWVDLFARGGFYIERVAPTGIPVGLAFPRWDDTLAVRATERLCHALARAWKRLCAYQFVVVARPETA